MTLMGAEEQDPSKRSAPPPSRRGAPATSAGRSETSLIGLTKRFMEIALQSKDGIVQLNLTAERLGVKKRRIYDITNVLQGINILEKKAKNHILLRNAPEMSRGDADQLERCRHDIEHAVQIESALDEQIKKLGVRIAAFLGGPCAYISVDDALASCGRPGNPDEPPQLTLLVQAPQGAHLEVQDPDADNGRVSLVCSHALDVYVLTSTPDQRAVRLRPLRTADEIMAAVRVFREGQGSSRDAAAADDDDAPPLSPSESDTESSGRSGAADKVITRTWAAGTAPYATAASLYSPCYGVPAAGGGGHATTTGLRRPRVAAVHAADLGSPPPPPPPSVGGDYAIAGLDALAAATDTTLGPPPCAAAALNPSFIPQRHFGALSSLFDPTEDSIQFRLFKVSPQHHTALELQSGGPGAAPPFSPMHAATVSNFWPWGSTFVVPSPSALANGHLHATRAPSLIFGPLPQALPHGLGFDDYGTGGGSQSAPQATAHGGGTLVKHAGDHRAIAGGRREGSAPLAEPAPSPGAQGCNLDFSLSDGFPASMSPSQAAAALHAVPGIYDTMDFSH